MHSACNQAWAQEYVFDRVHTQILFFTDHFGFSKSQGEFLDFAGRFTFDKNNFDKTQVEITIYADSIDMDDDKWNKKMRGKKYFNSEKYPTIKFVSTRIVPIDGKHATVQGNLTLLDKTLPVDVHMKFNKAGLNIATGKKTAGFSGHAKLKRSAFGMTTHLKYVGDEVEIRLEVEGFMENVRKHDS